jgi:hypothetical protein
MVLSSCKQTHRFAFGKYQFENWTQNPNIKVESPILDPSIKTICNFRSYNFHIPNKFFMLASY